MPLVVTPPDRIDFKGSVTSAEIDSLAANPVVRVLQTSLPAQWETWERINAELLTRRPDIEVRVYGFYSLDCDLSFLSCLENVRCFSADCLGRAKGLEQLSCLKNLERLSLGILSLGSFDCLTALPADRLQRLTLGSTRSKRPSLKPLERFTALKTLYVDGQQKDIETLARIESLEKLTLRSTSTSGLDFLRELKRLWSLDIKLGGTKDLSALEGLSQIKYLQLWQVRGLSDLSVIGTMVGLQYLFLQSLRHVRSLPNFSKLTALRRIYLENMKALSDVSSVETAPALEEFVHASAQNMKPGHYEPLLRIPTLKRARVLFGRALDTQKLREQLAQRKIEDHRPGSFAFA